MDGLELPPRAALVHTLLDDAAADAPAARAVRDADGGWTYRETADHSHAAAAWLRDRGVEPGDRVLVQWPTDRRLVALLYGASRAGAVLVPVNPDTRPFQLRSIVASAGPRLVLTANDRELAWKEIEDLRGRGVRADPAGTAPDDLAVLVYTSGSTSVPKGVMEPHAQIVFATRALVAALRYRASDVVFCRFPISWDYGLYKVLMCAAARCEIVLAGDESDLVLLRRMREVGATVVPIVPSLATMIVKLAGRAAGPSGGNRIRMFTNTGAALPPATADRLRAAFPGAVVVRQYGQTECKRAAVMPPEEERSRPGSCGRPLRGTAIAILGADGHEVPAGEVGEIVVTGPHVMPGYWREPELTARTFRTDPATGVRRLHTGDHGRVDEDGYLYFHGRVDDMFKRKGVRMSTLEIEGAALDIPGVRAAGVVPPSADRDLAICVEGDLPPHAVLRELARRLEPAKVPSLCHVVDALPLTAHGKNASTELAALLDEAVTR
ncbi:AMP-binding protein [Actinomadura latina]|uniref:AMP-binding protein n=1 Tax=Actinomadura latina TaxID=163603 RepID=A0A846Z990_9ACTN|nr:AMP-binding protein [Actinomadura latina]NKZ08317.1 AMP-binding protein [Actinomadura latina]